MKRVSADAILYGAGAMQAVAGLALLMVSTVRYRTFKDTTFGALESLRENFHFHFIDAEGDLRWARGEHPDRHAVGVQLPQPARSLDDRVTHSGMA